MTNTLSLKDLRPKLPQVIDRIDSRLDRYVVTKHGKPVVVMMGVDDYESLMETLDIMTDPQSLKRLRQGEAEIQEGKTQSWKHLKASLEKL